MPSLVLGSVLACFPGIHPTNSVCRPLQGRRPLASLWRARTSISVTGERLASRVSFLTQEEKERPFKKWDECFEAVPMLERSQLFLRARRNLSRYSML